MAVHLHNLADYCGVKLERAAKELSKIAPMYSAQIKEGFRPGYTWSTELCREHALLLLKRLGRRSRKDMEWLSGHDFKEGSYALPDGSHYCFKRFRLGQSHYLNSPDFAPAGPVEIPDLDLEAVDEYLAEGREERWQSLLSVANGKCRVSMEAMASLASKDRRAIFCLARNLVGGIRLLERLRELRPNDVKEVMSYFTSWPVIRSSHPFFDTKNQKELLKQLGTKLEFRIDEEARWVPQSYSSRIALELYEHVKRVRSDVHRRKEAIQPLLSARAANLQLFASGKAAEQWWEVAWEFLVDAYEPVTTPELRSLIPNSQVKTPGRIKAKIREKLRSAFIHLPGMVTD